MPLIGRQLIYGSNVKLDDISSQFNGTAATFNLSVSGRPFNPGNAYGLIVSLSGVIQEPNIAYTVTSSQITFSTPPLTTDKFFGYVLSSELTVGVPADRTITGVKLSDPFNYESGLLYLDSVNGRVGINTESPQDTLEVQGSIRFGSGENDGVLRNWTSADTDIDSVLPGSGFGTILEGGRFGHLVMGIRDNDTGDSFSIISGSGNYTTDATYDRLIAFFKCNGDVGIGTDNPAAKFHVSGGNIRVDNTFGIDFSANANVAGMTSELLDDYEEGTFTPTITGTTTAGAGTYTAQTGFYTKIGNRVTFQLYLVWTAHTGTGNLRVSGLPYTSSSQTNSHSAITLRYDDIVTSAGAIITGYVNPNSTQVILNQAAPTANNATGIPMDTAGGVMIAGHYYVL